MKGFNPEKTFGSKAELPEAEEALYKAIVPGNKERAIQLSEFSDLYGPEIIRKDQEYVDRLEAKFNESGTPETARKYGELMEALVNVGIEQIDLMGPSADVIVPSRFDDIANGIDSFVRFKEEHGAASHLALAIDVTRSRMEIANKFTRIKESIDAGTLSHAKYFKSKNFRGELKPVARVVIGADHEITGDISNLLLSFMRIKNVMAENRKIKNESQVAKDLPRQLAEIRKKLASHPFHEVILSEIRMELEAFHAYSMETGKQSLAEEYAKLLRIIDEVILDKDGPTKPENKEMVDKDEIYQLIAESAKSFGR